MTLRQQFLLSLLLIAAGLLGYFVGAGLGPFPTTQADWDDAVAKCSANGGVSSAATYSKSKGAQGGRLNTVVCNNGAVFSWSVFKE